MFKQLLMAAALAAGTTAVTAQQAGAPLRLIVGYSPGGGVDSIARAVGQELGNALNRNVVVENRPGAGSTLAADAAARAAPDGNTLFVADTTALLSPHVYAKVTYDLTTSFVPIGMISRVPLVIAVAPTFPANTLAELLDMARKEPGKYSYASAGIGSVHHLGFEMLKGSAGVDLQHVPYKGAAPALQDLTGGQIPVGVVSVAAGLPQAKAKRIKILATMSGSRLSMLPDTPAVSELVPGYDATPSIFLLAPTGTPQAAVQTLNAALKTVLEKKEIVDAIQAQGASAEPGTPGALSSWLQQEEQRWIGVIKRAGIRFE